METKSVRNYAMLGVLNIGTYDAKVKDDNAARDIESRAHAEKGTAKVRKNLASKDSPLHKVQKYATECRVWWSGVSSAWYDRGPRAFNGEMLIPLSQEIADRRGKFFELVEVFMPTYRPMVENRRFEMGSLFDEKDFPSEEEVRRKFYFEFEYSPMPNTADFRVVEGVPAAEVEKMIAEAQARERAKVGDALKAAAQRMYDAVDKMATRLDERNRDPKVRLFDTLTENIIELADIFPALNIINDPVLAEMAKKAKLLATVSPDVLREDDMVREKKATEARELAEQLKGMF